MADRNETYRGADAAVVGIVGTGLIGAAWTAYFLSRGLAVRAWDPAPGWEGRLEGFLGPAMADLAAVDPEAITGTERLALCCTLEEAAGGADYIQENAPEKLPLKQDLLARIDAAAPADVVIGSSTSSLRATDMQAMCANPARVLVAHPFNPPHLLPLVELVRGEKTDEAAQAAAAAFFEAVGKAPIRVRKEATGHVANRMTAALWREAVNIVAEGIASVEDVDKAIRYGPGLRWAIDGPHMLYHLGGGAGGIAQYLEHFGPSQERRWKELGDPKLTDAVKKALVEGVAAEARGRSIDALARRRDDALIDLLRALAKYEG
ncbi:3-hydroxyacyl-CoA dehydrogenase NAD-binding domain-containing protein [Futiania mangrovi]|uniref:3-hydroxyacyl-CoA dehydrogenase NAD-binding domain-containing protein n=1 Tax=Futiania mangrovi TaxID=2959716 RepID=A0A9J6PIW5_9PROT|nr:3-hydroxyacyl-CoA dehydrogenase NAD-binding domain-containing protein [Futiania mangrovii]MCP1337752.1 3-hydroxyacyl-CoA dehydrogenase NAD-binding domain-containing protein [Futiania mangrovii]